MTNVIPFPNGRTAKTFDGERRNDVLILFFTGVRYVRDEVSGDGPAPVAIPPADKPGAILHGHREAEPGAVERLQA